ncbi:TRAP transporter large permease, partial [Pseudothermotoga sp.]|nr:TRAP transporter large permease [Pseudothermotoga sp.]MDW8140530.1 TRAP transporter large permease [Pseudothermotoga sp.]
LWLHGSWQMVAVAAQRIYWGATSFVLLAVPFFILSGFLMNSSGMTKRITDFAELLVGRFTGGMGHVNVLTSMIFAGMSGSSVADASGVGVIEMEMMRKAGYDEAFSAAITAASATIGPVIPPSIPFVIYGAMTGTSVGKLFLAGIMPGMCMGIALMIAVYIVARKRGYKRIERRYTFRETLRVLLNGLIASGSFIIIIGGILSGFFTPTEAGIVACLYALLIGFIVYRELKMSDFIKILWVSVQSSVKILFIVGTAAFFSYSLTLMKAPQLVASYLGGLTHNPYLFLLAVNVILLILGCFMETISIMLLTVPVLLPIARTIGIDPVHFGVVVTLNLMIGQLTPPVGVLLYAVTTVSKAPLKEILRELWPYLIALLLVLVAVTYWPSLVMWIPRRVFP